MNSESSAKGGSADNNLKINAIGGKAVKTFQESKFIICGKNSEIFNFEKPRIKYVCIDRWEETEIVVLQAMIIGDGLFLCEVIDKEEFYKK